MLAVLKECATQLGRSASPQPGSWSTVDAPLSPGSFLQAPSSLTATDCHSQNLVFQLLQFNPSERLGAGVAGVEDIKSHPFFTPVDWAELTR